VDQCDQLRFACAGCAQKHDPVALKDLQLSV
jgi:hypothetical protein